MSFRYYSLWQNRFQADQEERKGCLLTTQLRLVITEDPEHLQALDTHEAEKEPGHSVVNDDIRLIPVYNSQRLI